MSYTLDVEQFISEIKKYPELWDISSEDYRLKSKKNAAWAKVASLFIIDFDEMKEPEKEDVYKKLFNKWRNIRDSYVRHVKKKYGKKGYIYAKNLAFLENVYNKQNPTSDEEWSDDDKKNLIYKPKIEITGWSEDEGSIDLKRKRSDLEFVDNSLLGDPVSVNTSGFPLAEDEDRSFFESLLPAVRSFNMDQKLEFRGEILNLVKRIRTEQRNSSTL